MRVLLVVFLGVGAIAAIAVMLFCGLLAFLAFDTLRLKLRRRNR